MHPELKRPFLFKQPESLDKDNLHQGDILENKGNLKEAVSQAHSYYAEAEDYTHFMVLSQSCDLVRRKGKCKSNYITIAAIRPFNLAFSRFVEKTAFSNLDFPIPILDESRRQEVKFKLERFVNNTVEDDGFFFISKYWNDIFEQDLCAFLQLSISLRECHYDACLEHKVAQVEDIFAAKVGWIAGNLFSRVAITDLSEQYDNEFSKLFKKKFSQEILDKQPPSLYKSQKDVLEMLVKQWKEDNPTETMNAEIAANILKNVPEMFTIISDQIVETLIKQKYIDATKKSEASTYLGNNKKFKSLIRQIMG